MGGFVGAQIALGLAIGLVVFFAGLAFWGDRFKRFRRTTIILYGIGGGIACIAAAALINHSQGQPDILRALYGLLAAGGLFVLAGATPAALGLLADVTESFPADRGAVMGLYSVFLALGQITGSFVGGESGRRFGIDGILGSTVVLLLIALVPLTRLRAVEQEIGAVPEGASVERA
ncbi:MAG: MFS transporter [Chloroflexi bacterium]|nr:MAG: MFS transporter [Chloroflexota bacterium]